MADQQLIDQHIKEVLTETILALIPPANPENLIRRHAWYDVNYVGTTDDKIATWRGWRANLHPLDSRYHTIYIDVVENVLLPSEQIELFGELFAQAIAEMSTFVVLFITRFPLDAWDELVAAGYIPRKLSRRLHGCLIVEIDDFLVSSPSTWVTKLVELVKLQRQISELKGIKQ